MGISTTPADRLAATHPDHVWAVGVLNDACLTLMVSIGHQTGLFDTMAGLPPSTSTEIAAAAHLHERYVREWLGAMTTGRGSTTTPTTAPTTCPPNTPPVSPGRLGPDNLATTMQLVPLLATVEGPVVECFRAGGGGPYETYTQFHRLMAEDSGAVHDAALVDAIVPLVPGLPDRLRAGIDVADVGCGSATPSTSWPSLPRQPLHRLRLLRGGHRRRPAGGGGARPHQRPLRAARRHRARGRRGLRRRHGLRRHPRPGAAGVGAGGDRPSAPTRRRVPHGRHPGVQQRGGQPRPPAGPFLYTVSTMHCMTVSLALGGVGLGTVWGRQLATRMLHDAGFPSVEVAQVEDDAFNDYVIAGKG